jgi:anti-sigma B factor antagonist
MHRDDAAGLWWDVQSSPDGRSSRVHLHGEIDLHTAPMLRDALGPLRGYVTLNFADVSFLDSVGVAVLVRYQSTLATQRGTLRLNDVGPTPYRVLELTGLVDLLNVQRQEGE